MVAALVSWLPSFSCNPTKINEKITPIAAMISEMDAQSVNFNFIVPPS
jgi:hypothetical protein